MADNKSELDKAQFLKQSLGIYSPDYEELFIEITKCGMRNWKKKNNKNVPILEHPIYSSYSRLDFIHLFTFIEHLVTENGSTFKDFKDELDATSIQSITFGQGRYRNVSPNIVEVGICTAARFLNTPLISLLTQFLEECEDAKIRLDGHQTYQKTIASFLRDAKHIASQQTLNDSQQQKQEPEQSLDERTETIDGLDLVSGKDKWLDPYNLSEITFVARDAELKSLNQFINHKDNFKIWAIEGPSGAGKTRLTIEWINRSQAGILNGWDLRILHKQDRFNLDYWSAWTPTKPTLIVIDYMFGFDQVIENLIGCCSKSLPHKVRLLVLDHVFPHPLHCDKRWGFSLDRSSLNRNERYFYDLKPLELSETQDQETVISGIISQRNSIDDQSNTLSEAIDYLKKTQGAWHPLFAALVGDVIKSGQNINKWNRRELIDYYLADKRLPWRLDDELLGRWAGYFISVSTARRGISYRDMISAAVACNSRPKHFGSVKDICHRIIADNDKLNLAQFEPDILGESFFLLFLKELEDSIDYKQEFQQIFLAGDTDTLVGDVIEFIGFIEHLTRNLLNDDQEESETQEFWQLLFDFLRPLNFPKHHVLRWAINAALLILIDETNEAFSCETRLRLLNQVDSTDLYEIEDSRLLRQSTFSSMQHFELNYSLKNNKSTIPANMHALLERNYQNDLGDDEENPLALAIFFNFLHTVESLLDHGQSPNAKFSEFNFTALSVACIHGRTCIVELLLDRGAQVDSTQSGWGTALWFASAKGYSKIVELLLNRGARIDAKNNKGVTPLMIACCWGHADTAELLLDQGANIYSVDNEGNTALIWACEHGHTLTVGLLLKRGANIDCKNSKGETALMIASCWGHANTAELLLDQGANIDSVDNEGNTALIWAAMNGHTQTMELLLNRGAHIDSENIKRNTALMYASGNGHTKTVELLLDRNAALIIKTNNNGATALIWASGKNHTQTVEILLNHGAEIECKSNKGETALMIASCCGNEDTVELLLDQGAKVDNVDNEGRTALIWAAINRCTKTAKLLLDWNASIDYADNDGLTALIHASNYGHTKTIALLINRGADINVSDKKGSSPLLISSAKGHTETVKKLLAFGSEINQKNSFGNTALMLASLNGHTETVEALIELKADIYALDNDGCNALIWASHNGHTDIAVRLYELGAKVNDKTNFEDTAILWASINGHTDTVVKLVELGAEINESGSLGITALMSASNKGHTQIVEKLLEFGADINAVDDQGRAAIMYAFMGGQSEIIHALLKHGGLMYKLI